VRAAAGSSPAAKDPAASAPGIWGEVLEGPNLPRGRQRDAASPSLGCSCGVAEPVGFGAQAMGSTDHRAQRKEKGHRGVGAQDRSASPSPLGHRRKLPSLPSACLGFHRENEDDEPGGDSEKWVGETSPLGQIDSVFQVGAARDRRKTHQAPAQRQTYQSANRGSSRNGPVLFMASQWPVEAAESFHRPSPNLSTVPTGPSTMRREEEKRQGQVERL